MNSKKKVKCPTGSKKEGGNCYVEISDSFPKRLPPSKEDTTVEKIVDFSPYELVDPSSLVVNSGFEIDLPERKIKCSPRTITQGDSRCDQMMGSQCWSPINKSISDQKSEHRYLKALRDLLEEKKKLQQKNFELLKSGKYSVSDKQLVQAFVKTSKLEKNGIKIEQLQFLRAINKFKERDFKKSPLSENEKLAVDMAFLEISQKHHVFKEYLSPGVSDMIEKYSKKKKKDRMQQLSGDDNNTVVAAVVGGLFVATAVYSYKVVKSVVGTICDDNRDDFPDLDIDEDFDIPSLPRDGWTDPPPPGFN